MEDVKIKREGGGHERSETTRRKGKAVLLVELSGSVGIQGVLWQESGTATQLCFVVKGHPRFVSLYFIVREKKGRETPET